MTLPKTIVVVAVALLAAAGSFPTSETATAKELLLEDSIAANLTDPDIDFVPAGAEHFFWLGDSDADGVTDKRNNCCANSTANPRVGHSIKQIFVPEKLDEPLGVSRPVDVHVWYPADHRGLSDAPKTRYTSTLRGVALGPQWDPLSWTIEARFAHEDVAIDSSGKAFPVIVFSHGSNNEPIDYAYTLERIAGEGFVVAAPSHTNNAQDDVRIDFVNEQLREQPGSKLLDCRDGPTRRTCALEATPLDIRRSMQDRAKDVSFVLNALAGWYGDRVDVSRAGVMGHSRGTATALAVAGGASVAAAPNECVSGPWGIVPEARVKAIMGLAIAVRSITVCANLERVTVPALLVAGTRDRTSPPAISEEAFSKAASEEKAFVLIRNATHRTFDSTYCAQMQASGAIAQANPRALLDRHTATGILRDRRGLSGVATDYCTYEAFTNPVDIRTLVATVTPFPVKEDTVPSTGLATEEVEQGMTELAVTFFGTVLKRTGNDGPHFTRFLAPKWLEKHEPMVERAEAVAGADAICPPGLEVVCDD